MHRSSCILDKCWTHASVSGLRCVQEDSKVTVCRAMAHRQECPWLSRGCLSGAHAAAGPPLQPAQTCQHDQGATLAVADLSHVMRPESSTDLELTCILL